MGSRSGSSSGSSTSSRVSCSGFNPFSTACPTQNAAHSFTAVANSGVSMSHEYSPALAKTKRRPTLAKTRYWAASGHISSQASNLAVSGGTVILPRSS